MPTKLFESDFITIDLQSLFDNTNNTDTAVNSKGELTVKQNID